MKEGVIYNKKDQPIGTFHYMKNKNMLGIRFDDTCYFADITLDYNDFARYRAQFGFKLEDELENAQPEVG